MAPIGFWMVLLLGFRSMAYWRVGEPGCVQLSHQVMNLWASSRV